MAQPPAYDRAYSFSGYQTSNPSAPLPAAQVEIELNRVKATLDAVLTNIAVIQRDDTALANNSVGRDQLKAEITVGFNVPTRWLTSTQYVVSDTVFKDLKFYSCEVSHVSGVFATDLAAGKWVEIADFASTSNSAEATTYDNTVSGLAAANAQDAIDELASEKLDKAGGTMSGAVNMGSQRITNLPAPAAANDAMRRVAVDGARAAKTGAYSVAAGDYRSLISCDATSAGFTVSLPAVAAVWDGFTVTVQKSDSSTNVVTIDGDGAETINGAATFALGIQWQAATLRCNGTAWEVAGEANDNLALGQIPDALLTYAKMSAAMIEAITPAGTIAAWGGTSAPTGWLLCYGQAVSRTTYAQLFTNIGTTYGAGDGSTTFNLPDIRGRVIAGQDDMGGVSADRLTNQTGGLDGDTLGATGGAETHTTTTAQMPLHGHALRISTTSSGASDGFGGVMLDTAGQTTSAAFTGTPSGTVGEQLGGTGGGGAHNNVQPTLVLNYIIKAH